MGLNGGLYWRELSALAGGPVTRCGDLVFERPDREPLERAALLAYEAARLADMWGREWAGQLRKIAAEMEEHVR